MSPLHVEPQILCSNLFIYSKETDYNKYLSVNNCDAVKKEGQGSELPAFASQVRLSQAIYFIEPLGINLAREVLKFIHPAEVKNVFSLP